MPPSPSPNTATLTPPAELRNRLRGRGANSEQANFWNGKEWVPNTAMVLYGPKAFF